jgi:thymidylate kinase
MSEFNAMQKLMKHQGEVVPAFPRQLSREAHLGIIEEMYKALLNYSDHVFDLEPILAEEPRHGSLLELLADAQLRKDGGTPGAMADQLGNLMALQGIAATVSAFQGFQQDYSWAKFLSNAYTGKENTFKYLEQDIMPLKGIIVLEGPDCTGKTTLANHFVDTYGAKYIHGTWSEEAELVQHTILMEQIAEAVSIADAGGLVIIDRSWITEFIYADVFRGGTSWPELAEDGFLELMANDAIYVFCMPFSPISVEKHRKRFLARANNGGEMYLEMGKIVEAYHCFVFGLKHAQALAEDDIPADNPDPDDNDPDLSTGQDDGIQEGDALNTRDFTPFRFDEDHRPELLGKFWPEEDDALGSLRACIFDCDIDPDYTLLMQRIAELKGITPTM